MAKRKRRAFTKEFKAQAVGIARDRGKTADAMAGELDLTDMALRSWVFARRGERASLQPVV